MHRGSNHFDRPVGGISSAGHHLSSARFHPDPGRREKSCLAVISASGYATLLLSARLTTTTTQVCDQSSSTTNCSFSLQTGLINGTASLVEAPPPGDSVQVMVLAENTGTSQLVSALSAPLNFINGFTSLPFTINVPFNGEQQNFDLLAFAIDPYLGASAPFPGHTIAVLSSQAGPAEACQPAAENAAFEPLDCVGHGSITGTLVGPDLGSGVEVTKTEGGQPVDILETEPNLFSSNTPSNNQYTLCLPPDAYTLQRLENGSPVGGDSQTIAVPQPAATSTPCPSTCSSDSTGATCPGQCAATFAAPL